MIYVIKEVLITNLRRRKWILFNMILPIVLMLILGALLTNQFHKTAENDNLKVLYFDNGNEESKNILKHAIENEDDFNINFVEAESVEDAKKATKNQTTPFVYLDNDTIKIYTNAKYPIDESRVYGIFTGIANKSSLMKEMYKFNPMLASSTDNEKIEEIPFAEIKESKIMTSYDYYGVVEISGTIIYAMLFPLNCIFYEKQMKAKDRIRLTGISNFKYYLSHFWGYAILELMIILPGFLFSKYILNINWGQNSIICLLGIETLACFSIIIGIFLGAKLDSKDKVEPIITSLIIPIFSFLGGSYIKLDNDLNGFFGVITNLSPLRWINKALMTYIYENSSQLIFEVIAVLVGLIVLGLFITTRVADKEELSL